MRRFALALGMLLAAGCSGDTETTMLIQIESSTLLVPDDVDELCIEVYGESSMTMVDGCHAIDAFPQSQVVRATTDPNQAVRITVRGRRMRTERIRRIERSQFVEGRNVVVVVQLERVCYDVMCREGFGCIDGRCMPGGEYPDGGPIGACTVDMDCPDDGIACLVERCVDNVCTREPDPSVCAPGEVCHETTGCGARCTPPPMPDAGPGGDAGPGADAGPTPDAGSADGGVPLDAGPPDAGPPDSGPPPDAGPVEDAGPPPDSGPPPDGGPAPDGGTALDGGPPPSTGCDDGNFCTAEICTPEGVCVLAPTGPCDDGIACTTDTCSSEFSTCTHTPDHAACSDADPCNGDEVCDVAAGCLPGTPIDCDDLTDCTDDSCNSSDGSCLHDTHDGDGDGYGDRLCPPVGSVTADDCDDADGDVHPGAPEVCNGLDDDCDGASDEDFTCSAGGSGTCTTSCGSEGSRVCSAACGWSVCTPPEETCNGADDDCNGACDDGFTCCRGSRIPCTTSCGTTGERLCDDLCAPSECFPPVEDCTNGRDDDCDGQIDARDPGCGGSCATDADCDDRRPCNGPETCVRDTDGAMRCAAGAPLVCNDGILCTVDDCDDARGGCVHDPNAALCDDGGFCNGPEACDPLAGCVPGPPPVCDDSNACTDDSCGGAAPGACRNTTRDADRDGRGDAMCPASGGVPANDCDDSDPAIYTGAPELCNGTDDDCDATCDDGFACCRAASESCATACGTTGTRTCSAVCSWGVCAPPAETCNGIDDDCNGACDEGLAPSSCCAGGTGLCTTSCGSTGSRVCSSSCAWGSCTPPMEACNGVDDDCDGERDEGFGCIAGTSGSCSTACGSTGTRLCSGSCGWGTCRPPVEACNGADDDCDTFVDEDFTCAAGSSSSCLASCGTTGSRTCSSTCAWGACTAPAEACNGGDDDCDSFVDEGFTCAAGSSSSCTASCGTTGSRTCSAACAWGSCRPPAESCNGADDDCDGLPDDGFACAAGGSGTCTTSCGTTGSRTCSGTCTWSACSPPAEVCNGGDDDCDGSVDDGFTCAAGTTGTCTTSCGTTGSRTCSATCSWGSCTAPAEVCNGLDDDCDGSRDEGFTCTAGANGSCTTSCGTTGSRTCAADCSWGTCNPPAESCNGLDDDCDGMVDELLACAAGSTESCTTACGTTGSRTCSSSCNWGPCTPPSEICNGADDDCDTVADDGFVCAAGASGSCTTGCGSTGSRLCSASCAWGSCTPPAETCNGVDDDCDSMRDEGFTCIAGASGSCSTSCGSTGSRVCDSRCAWGTCNPPAEACNGADDDCDGVADNGFLCAVGSSSSCLSSCGTTGTRVCGASCAWGSCTPPPEVCNGADDDCDTFADETFTCAAGATGSCTTSCMSTGTRRCSASCDWGMCTPPAETCNGRDDDCDGTVDDGFTCAPGTSGTCLTSCGSTGSRVCSASCAWGMCTPPAEVCNGADDDCDTFVDDGFTCSVGATSSCTTSCGSVGMRTCGASCTWGACIAPVEVCNGADDDCDGLVDDGFTCAVGATGSCTASCGTTGSRTCTAACTWGACTPPAEVCNGADDDCNGAPDDSFTCAAGSTGACTSSCGTPGSRTCSATCAWGTCNAPAESCNGADDDCDAMCDDGFACCAGASGSCSTSCGTTGTRTCSASCGWSACSPPAESCNGVDDDCNMLCDDGYACCRGATGSCTTTCGSTGARTCGASCTWGSCAPPAETCNGLDDDCDGVADDGFTCAAGSTRTCTTGCSTTGTQVCSSSCGWGACTPPAETCNGADDDCDAMCDDGFACCRGSSGSCTTSCGSTGSRTCGATCGWGACTPPAEVCNGADDDCDALVDDGFTCAVGTMSTCTTTCGSTGSRTCGATCAWGTCNPPGEVCNGADDDCDAMVDDGFTCAAGSTGSCTTTCGTTGSRLCSPSCAWGACAPPAESCNGADDDCDTRIDETLACSPGGMESCMTSCGTTGSRTCSAACSWGACLPPAETCNGIDDDCDAACDDGFTCCVGATGPCTTGCGSTGSRTCGAACGWGACTPPAESCNGVDDDCDALCDETFACCAGQTGSCTTSCGTTGSRTCSGTCAWSACSPPAETCNGVDDNCNTLCDDGFTCCRGATGTCTTTCGTTGSRVCNTSCGWPATCTPPAETCNGTDDDCDALCDETFACCRGASQACTTSCGTTGSQVCNSSCGWDACVPPAEVCNGADDDCDSMIDDGFACSPGATQSCTSSCGTTGMRTCSASCTWGACVPPAEVCNGADDDCDAVPDDGFTCAAGATGSCMTGCSTTGSRTCSAMCMWGACVPPLEVCNGSDDDCDTTCDEGFACCAGQTGSCTTGCGTTGTRTCSGSCAWSACSPPAETCNGIDDNCNAVCDDGFTCCAGSSGSCVTSCGSTGSRTCSGSCAWGATCTPPAEVCNGADDDCVSGCDNGFACCRGATGTCITTCGSTGTRTCNTSCAWGMCTPPAEVCNGADDDCDAMIDDGFACSPGATQSCTTTCGTAGTQTCTGSCTWGSCVPPAEVCNGIDDDCDTVADDGFTCPAGGTGSCMTTCSTTGTRTCSAMCTWGMCNPPSEACNGADDDCDALCDDGFACCAGSSGSCMTSCGTTGTRTCSGSCAWSACSPPAETCNGVDDDCNSVCDDGVGACCRGSTGSCTTSCGSTGSRLCSSTCAWGSCTAPAEVCNGADDDCVSGCDNGFACCAGATRSCTTSCGSTGTESCTGSCAWSGTCTPPAESTAAGNCSNGVDDDCDGFMDGADMDCMAGACPGAVNILAPGGRYTAALVPHVYQGSCGGAGAEAYFSFTLTATSDVFLATHQTAGINTVLYVRSTTCTGTQVGCNADADGLSTSRLSLTGLAAGTYNVFVDTVSGVMSGMVTLDAYISTPGTASDRCGNPTFIPAGTASISGNIVGFTNDYTVTCSVAGREDRVYYFYLPTSRAVTFNGCHATNRYDQIASLRSVCSNAGAEVACNDDDGCGGSPSFCDSGRYNSAVTVTIGPGLYYFFVDGYGPIGNSCDTLGAYTFAITGI